MLLVTFVSLIAILLTLLESHSVIKNGMILGFVLITTLLCIHYDYGNDYMPYYNMYKDIAATQFSWDVISSSMIHHDSGWVLLNYIFKPFGGFFTLVIFLSIVQNVIIYKFIKREVALNNQTFAVFIYLMTTSFYLMSFSMLRQWFVVCVFLGCWTLIKERKWFKVLLILYLCSFIHGSAKILLPFAFWGYLPLKNGKVLVLFWGLLFMLFFSARNLVNDILVFFQESGEFDIYFERYGDVSNDFTIGIGFILQLLPLFVTFWFLLNNYGTIDQRSLVIMSSIGFLLMFFSSSIPMLGRISTYFTIFKIASIPLMYSIIRNKIIRYGLTTLLLLLTFYDYIIFFSNPVWIEKYTVFKTIFSEISL